MRSILRSLLTFDFDKLGRLVSLARHNTVASQQERKKMRKLLVSLILISSAAAAGQSMYLCSISAAYSVDIEGSLVEWPSITDHLRQQTFSVERSTGVVTAEFHTNTSPIVAWNPDPGDGNAYLVVDRAKSPRTAFTSSLVIEEHVSSDQKPFLWQWDSHVLTGSCT